MFLFNLGDDIYLIILLTLCAFEFMMEQNIYKFLREANVHLSKGKEIELQPTTSISSFFKVFDLTRHKIYKFIWSIDSRR